MGLVDALGEHGLDRLTRWLVARGASKAAPPSVSSRPPFGAENLVAEAALLWVDCRMPESSSFAGHHVPTEVLLSPVQECG